MLTIHWVCEMLEHFDTLFTFRLISNIIKIRSRMVTTVKNNCLQANKPQMSHDRMTTMTCHRIEVQLKLTSKLCRPRTKTTWMKMFILSKHRKPVANHLITTKMRKFESHLGRCWTDEKASTYCLAFHLTSRTFVF